MLFPPFPVCCGLIFFFDTFDIVLPSKVVVRLIVAVNGVDVAVVDVLVLLDVVAIAGATLAEALAPTAAWSADTVADRFA